MAESLDLFAEVATIRDMLEDHGAMLGAMLRSMPGVRDAMLEELRKDTAAVNVLLLVDGKRSQTEMVAELKASEADGGSPATVSRKLRKLQHLGLIEPTREAKGQVWRLTQVNQALRITHELSSRP